MNTCHLAANILWLLISPKLGDKGYTKKRLLPVGSVVTVMKWYLVLYKCMLSQKKGHTALQ